MKCVICKHGETEPGKATVTLTVGQANGAMRVSAATCRSAARKWIEPVQRSLKILSSGEFSTRPWLSGEANLGAPPCFKVSRMTRMWGVTITAASRCGFAEAASGQALAMGKPMKSAIGSMRIRLPSTICRPLFCI